MQCDDNSYEITYVPSVQKNAKLALLRDNSRGLGLASQKRPVLFFHGATVPTLMTSGYKMNGISWFDSVTDDKRSAWGLDLLGYGASDPYPCCNCKEAELCSNNYGTSQTLVGDVHSVVENLLGQTDFDSLHIIAISRGVMPAGYYASHHPERVKSLTLHGPITRQKNKGHELLLELFGSPELPRIKQFELTAQRRFEMLRDDKPEAAVSQLEPDFVDNWTKDYNYLFHGTRTIDAPPISAPIGFLHDIVNAWNGIYYDPKKISMPTLLLRGEWDNVLTPAASCQNLFDEIASPDKRYIQMAQSTHSILFEKQRHFLYETVNRFMNEFD